MGFIQIENGLLAEAIKKLEPQYRKAYGYEGHFYFGNGIPFLVIHEGENKGKLTVAKRTIDWKFIPDPNIEPVDCYNLMLPGEDIATAVNRIIFGKSDFRR